MSKELTGTEGVDYVVCRICNKRFRAITQTHLKTHNIVRLEYINMFPDVIMECSNVVSVRKITNLEKYGVENPLKLQAIKDKKTKTCIEHYGVNHISQSQIIKDKKKDTCLKHFGVENPFQSQNVKDKMKITNIEKYGVEYTSQSEIIKDKKKETCLEHFGVESPLQSQIIKDKKNETCLNRYGFISPSKNFDIKIKLSCNLQNINIKDFNGFISFDPYCEAFNLTKKKEVREKYNNCDYLTGIHRDICNVMKNGKIWELSVHHVDYNKNQGCDGVKWKLVPVSQKHNTMFNKNKLFWEKLILYSLKYDKDYYKYEKINIFGCD